MYKAEGEISMPSMELFIETLTGTSMILHVSPLDTVFDVKTHIQKLEGIPASQQHLVWQSSELNDGQSLQDCHVHSGATLRLVLNMRGGPINTRRVLVDDPTVVEEYFTEASRSDLLSSASRRHRRVTVVVCQTGDQLKFYQLMPGTDMSSPISSSQSSSEDDLGTDEEVMMYTKEKEQCEENRKTRDRMKLVRSQMDECSSLKEKKAKIPSTKSSLPRSPSTGHPVFANRLRHTSGTSKKPAPLEVDKRPRPAIPATTSLTSAQLSDYCEQLTAKESPLLPTSRSDSPGTRMSPVAAETHRSMYQEHEVPEAIAESSNIPCVSALEDSLPTVSETKDIKDDVSRLSEVKLANPGLAAVEFKECECFRDQTLKAFNEPVKMATSTSAASKSRGSKSLVSSDRPRRDPVISACSKAASAFSPATSTEQALPTVTKRVRARNEGGMMLRSLDSQETRIMSGLLTSLIQGNGCRLVSGSCYQLVRSRKNCSSLSAKSPRVLHSNPVTATLAKGTESAEKEDCQSAVSSVPCFPTVSTAKTSTKRCHVCNKKTSLATNFQCRCGGNFCNLHRYAEAHSCSVDYRAEGRRLIEQNNPLVTADKLPKI